MRWVFQQPWGASILFASKSVSTRTLRTRIISQMTTTALSVKRLDWINALFLVASHGLALWGLVYMFQHFSPWTLIQAIVWFTLCGLSITGGYHRLYSHPTYKAKKWVEILYLCFGAASVQNSALKWSDDHRRHHSSTDTDRDPYNIRRGFWWAHIGWVFFKSQETGGMTRVPDLLRNRLVVFQDRYYVPIAIAFGVIVPGLVASLWGDAMGGILIAGFLRLVVQYHATFSINSVAHLIGKQPYSDKDSARDSWITALITMGEGYHNYHHSFPADYRNGVRAWQFDPTKWWVWTLSKVGQTSDLRRTPWEKILRARNLQIDRKRQAA